MKYATAPRPMAGGFLISERPRLGTAEARRALAATTIAREAHAAGRGAVDAVVEWFRDLERNDERIRVREEAAARGRHPAGSGLPPPGRKVFLEPDAENNVAQAGLKISAVPEHSGPPMRFCGCGPRPRVDVRTNISATAGTAPATKTERRNRAAAERAAGVDPGRRAARFCGQVLAVPVFAWAALAADALLEGWLR